MTQLFAYPSTPWLYVPTENAMYSITAPVVKFGLIVSMALTAWWERMLLKYAFETKIKFSSQGSGPIHHQV